MAKRKLNVLEGTLKVEGVIRKNDGRRRIDLKKPIRDLFEALEGTAKIKYAMELCLTKKKALNRTKALLEEGVVPILFYFEEESRNEELK